LESVLKAPSNDYLRRGGYRHGFPADPSVELVRYSSYPYRGGGSKFRRQWFKKHFTFKSRGSQDPEPPPSGGSGTLQANPGLEINTLILCLAALGIIAAVGLLIGAFLG
jgi:hypothetical protein